MHELPQQFENSNEINLEQLQVQHAENVEHAKIDTEQVQISELDKLSE